MSTTGGGAARSARVRFRGWMARRTRVGRLVVRLWMAWIVALALYIAHILTILDGIVLTVCSVILVPLLLVLFYRWVMQRVLWKVRNRLILTYLLMGLSPVVLFGTLGGIAAYLLAGQYATTSALTVIDQETARVKDVTASEAVYATGLGTKGLPVGTPQRAALLAGSRISVSVLDGGTWKPLVSAPGSGSASASLTANPAWLKAPFRGVIEVNDQLLLCSVSSVETAGKPVVLLGTMPLDEQELGVVASGLGVVKVSPGFTKLPKDVDEKSGDLVLEDNDEAKTAAAKNKQPKITVKEGGETKYTVVPDPKQKFAYVEGGQLPPMAHFFDWPVYFSAPLTNIAWETGDSRQALMAVTSRPTLLYAHLFATSVVVGVIVRIVLIIITAVFALVELLALLMAMGLSRTITRAVADLYRGTREIDAGNLAHRVRVAKHDQLGSLATSFNSMAASVSGLLVQQREQERVLNELAIAQEVQTTLFPHSPALLGGLEMHALSLPARTVGGDYFDFIFGSHSGLCLALGDISGKGISAALLMASLHSAVRAFSLGHDQGDGEMPSPALLLKLLNRHLYLSTQSARYATLFLAFYDPKTKRLTYSNGGHLPPMLLSNDGKVKRLDRGGSVVGLLDDLDYEEATVQMNVGDLLVAFTDGLTEPENGNGEEFGETQLLALMQAHRGEALPEIAVTTLAALRTWIGNSEQPDDMTILLARQT
jgi:sigma-B regulation protein RsbU (phosphoserine phosphatase)